jgi:hypothetical protein
VPGFPQASPALPLVTPSPLAFGNVLAQVSYAQTVLISNVGSTDLTVTQIAASGTGFGVSGLSLPLTLLAGQSAPIAVTFESATYGSDSGTVAIASNAIGSPTTIGLSASVGAPYVQLSANPTSISFGNTTIGVGATQNVTLTNAGNSTVNISSASASGTGFMVGGVPAVTLAPNQTINVAVNFDPNAAGLATGSLAITSNAPQVQVALSGTGAAAGTYSVALNWNPSTSAVIGYYIYRGMGANPQLLKLSSAIVAATSYQDAGVAAGQTYTYAVTSVDSAGVESVLSTSVTVNIP